MSSPLVSVVVPCRNERQTLGALLDALEQQDFPAERFETLLVDGGSTDGCAELARSRGVRLLGDPGGGPSAARNVGIHAARGSIIAFTDADCVPRFDWLSRIVARMEEEPGLSGVAGALRLPRETLVGRAEDNDARMRYHGYITSNVAYRLDALLAVDGFDESLTCAEDYDLAWRLMEAGHRIGHEERAIVLHDPPELRALGPYLRKQMWYARNDWPAHARSLGRAWRRGDASAATLAKLRGGAQDAACAAALLGGLVARSPATIGLAAGTIAARAAVHVARNVHGVGEGGREAPAMAAAGAAKLAARGLGALLGLADFARPSRWDAFSAPAGAGDAPSRRRAPALRARS